MKFLLIFFLIWKSSGLAHSDSSFSFRSTLSDHIQEKLTHCDSIQGPQKLVCEILSALDAQGQNTSNPEPKKAQNPWPKCRFKSEGAQKLHRYASAPSPQLQAVMDSYNSMHRRCTTLEFKNITNIYNSLEIPRCKYVIWGAGNYGLGNRLISFISAFIYALLSQRVILIDYPEWNQLFCDPFEGSPLQVPQEPPMKSLGISYFGLRDPGCRIQMGKTQFPCSNATILNTLLHHHTRVEELEFVVCPKGISLARNIPFVIMKESNQYYAPGYFLNPAVSPVLDILFPERNPFHVLSKYFFSPSDHVWDQIRIYADATFLKSRRKIGAQIREFRNGYTEAFDTNVLMCIQRKSGFVPINLRKHNKMAHSDDYFSVYVATLAQGHIMKLNQSLNLVKNETGKSFRVSWQKLDGREVHDASHQQQALIDMWVLSLSDVLVVSPRSTFGYIAQAFGGVLAYFIHPDPELVCEVSMGNDPCYQNAPNGLVCEEDSMKLSAKELLNQSRTVKGCRDIPDGWQLVLPF